jgi:hypothetical protein
MRLLTFELFESAMSIYTLKGSAQGCQIAGFVLDEETVDQDALDNFQLTPKCHVSKH